MDTIIGVLANPACNGLGVNPCSHGTQGSSQTLIEAPSPMRWQVPLAIIFFAPSMAFQTGEADFGGSSPLYWMMITATLIAGTWILLCMYHLFCTSYNLSVYYLLSGLRFS